MAQATDTASFQWTQMTAPTPDAAAGGPPLATAPALATDPPPDIKDKPTWEAWRASIRIVNGVVGAVKDLVVQGKIPVPASVAQPLVAAFYGLNAALVDVDRAFYDYLRTGDLSAFEIDPPPEVAWDPPSAPGTGTLQLFGNLLDVVMGALQLESGKLEAKLASKPDLQVVYSAVSVLINNEADVLSAIKSVLEPAPAPAPAPVSAVAP